MVQKVIKNPQAYPIGTGIKVIENKGINHIWKFQLMIWVCVYVCVRVCVCVCVCVHDSTTSAPPLSPPALHNSIGSVHTMGHTIGGRGGEGDVGSRWGREGRPLDTN